MAGTWCQQQQQMSSRKWPCCSALLVHLFMMCCHQYTASAKVVQLVPGNPSPFVSSDPNDPQYIVSLFDDADKARLVMPEVPSLRSLVMTDAAGRRFNCSIPSSPPAASTALSPGQVATGQSAQVEKSPFELLEALTALCLYHKDGLWTYELCHRKHVRQFRKQIGSSISTTTLEGGSLAVVVEANTPDFQQLVDAAKAGDVSKLLSHVLNRDDESGREQEDFSCGQYNGDDQQIEAIFEDSSSSGHPIKYVSHTFSGGAKCVLTGQSRTAEVRYTCARDTQENMILSVREFPTCNYVVVVSTPFLCRHQAFQPQAEDIRLVACVPLDWSGSEGAASKERRRDQVGDLEAVVGQRGAGNTGGQDHHLEKAAAQSKPPALQGTAAATAMLTKGAPARQQPPEIGIQLKSSQREERSRSVAARFNKHELLQRQQQMDATVEDVQQLLEEEEANDVEGFVVLSYDDGTEDSEGQTTGDSAGNSGVGGGSSIQDSRSVRAEGVKEANEAASDSDASGASDGDNSRHANSVQHQEL